MDWKNRRIDALLEQALVEDKAASDTTTNLTIDPDLRATATILARQEMVVAGLGITLLPELAVESPFGSQRGLAVRRFAKPAPSRTVGAVWRKSSTRTPVITAVCDVIDRFMTSRS